MVLDIWMAKYQMMCRESVTQDEQCNRPRGHVGPHYRFMTKEAANREWIPYLHQVQTIPSASEEEQREQQLAEDRERGRKLREQFRLAREVIDNGPKWLQQAADRYQQSIEPKPERWWGEIMAERNNEVPNKDVPEGEIRTWPVQGKLTTFELYRRNDESGVSGTGLVLQGCIFKDGTVTVRWCTENADQSTTVYGVEGGKSGWERFLDIHVQSHPTNDVRIVFYSQSRPGYEWNQRSDEAAIREKLEERLINILRDLKVLPKEEKSAL